MHESYVSDSITHQLIYSRLHVHLTQVFFTVLLEMSLYSNKKLDGQVDEENFW